mgnify:CR=1 FL=1
MTEPATINAAKWISSGTIAAAGFVVTQVESVPGELVSPLVQGGSLAILAGIIWQLLHLHAQQARELATLLREIHREIASHAELLRRLVDRDR